MFLIIYYFWPKDSEIMKKLLLLGCLLLLLACTGTRNTIQNIDDNAVMPALSKEKYFVITETSTDKKYGYDQDYPINLGFLPFQSAEVNVKRYFGGLTGPEGQTLSYTKVDACCPFPTKKYTMGAGLLDVYNVTWEGLGEPKKLYINLYEKGKVMAPVGFGIKKP